MEQHDREGILAGMLPGATAKMLAVMPRAMAIDALQALIQPIAQQVRCACLLDIHRTGRRPMAMSCAARGDCEDAGSDAACHSHRCRADSIAVQM